MRSFMYMAVSAFAAFAAAQSNDNPFNVPNEGYDFTAGEPTTVTWDPTTDGTITLKLQIGTDITPESGIVIASNIPNSGSFAFVPPTTVEPGTEYTVEIIDDTNPDNYNFTPTFTIDNPSYTPTTSAEPTTTTDATTTSETTETTTGTDSSETASGTTMVTSSGTATTSGSEESTGTTSAEPTVQSTTAPGAGVSLKVQGGMFALVAGVMAAL